MHRSLAVVAVIAGGTACASRTTCPPSPAPVAVPVASTLTPTREIGTSAANAANGSRTSLCFPQGRPRGLWPALAKQDARVEESRPFCTGFDEVEIGRVERRIRTDFVKHEKPSLLVVDWGCDEAYGATRELVYESGSGHGGTLRLVRFQWHTDGRVSVRRIVSSHYYAPGVVVSAAETSTAKMDPLLTKSRVAMLARPHLVRLESKNGASLGLSGMSSSNDFHLLLHITDEAGRVTAKHFTGYEGSAEQELILPMRLATEPMDKLIASLSFAPITPTEEDRAFFTTRLLTTLANKPHWWVKERYVEDASKLATPDALPALAAIAQEKGEASADRAREAALDAIASISGWNPRVDGAGKPRSVDEAARVVKEECSP